MTVSSFPDALCCTSWALITVCSLVGFHLTSVECLVINRFSMQSCLQVGWIHHPRRLRPWQTFMHDVRPRLGCEHTAPSCHAQGCSPSAEVCTVHSLLSCTRSVAWANFIIVILGDVWKYKYLSLFHRSQPVSVYAFTGTPSLLELVPMSVAAEIQRLELEYVNL